MKSLQARCSLSDPCTGGSAVPVSPLVLLLLGMLFADPFVLAPGSAEARY